MLGIKKQRLDPILKYPGGKERELKFILPLIREGKGRYFEPFVGGGAVFFSLELDSAFINDSSEELMSLYRLIKAGDQSFFDALRAIDKSWDMGGELSKAHMSELELIYAELRSGRLSDSMFSYVCDGFVYKNRAAFAELTDTGNIDHSLKNCFMDSGAGAERFFSELSDSLKNKLVRMKRLEEKKAALCHEDVQLNLETAIKNAIYMYYRYLYNHGQELSLDTAWQSALYYFIREYCFSSMFRYNSEGRFNVPYGGISYNHKTLKKKIEYLSSAGLREQLSDTVIEAMDFEDFFEKHEPRAGDLIFLDPPYDTEFSTYAGMKFGREDQKRLADWLIDSCRADFLLVIKDTELIRSLYHEGQTTASGGRLRIQSFDKKYSVSFRDRNDRKAEHLLIMNY